MLARLFAAFAIVLVLGAAAAEARNPAYYGTPRRASARFYSGDYRVQNPVNVPTFSLPVFGGSTRFVPARRFGRFYGPVYQPVVVYPPVVYYGF